MRYIVERNGGVESVDLGLVNYGRVTVLVLHRPRVVIYQFSGKDCVNLCEIGGALRVGKWYSDLPADQETRPHDLYGDTFMAYVLNDG